MPRLVVKKHRLPKPKKKPPFPFVLELLDDLEITTKPMFGCLALYLGSKIVLILREKEDHLRDNGVWIATTHEHHDSLRKDFPIMRSIEIFGGGPTSWQNLPSDELEFESSVEKVCQLILEGDLRIGKVPQKKNKTTKEKKKAQKKKK